MTPKTSVLLKLNQDECAAYLGPVSLTFAVRLDPSSTCFGLFSQSFVKNVLSAVNL